MTLLSRLVFPIEKKTPKKSSEKIKIEEISIVIPVKDNQKGIDRYLSDLIKTQLHYPKEVIIVDNNSRVPIFLKEEYKHFGLNIKIVSCSKPGPAAARNLGARVATGVWMLFNDSDCVPTASLIEGYLKADNGSLAYAGNVKSLGTDWLSQYYETQEILLPLKVPTDYGDFTPQYLITANSLVQKEAFVTIGGFNEDIRIAGGEDVDLGLKISQLGNLAYALESVAYHNFDDGLSGFCRRFVRYGQGNRIVETLWGTKMKPTLFRPNEKTLLNEIAAKFQYFLLLIGYTKMAFLNLAGKLPSRGKIP